MNHHEAHKRLLAAQKLLLELSTTREKFNSICVLIQGINPAVDNALAECQRQLSTLDKLQDGDVIGLSAEHLPENTEEEKRRKKWLLLFIHSWKQLKSEVARVSQEIHADPQTSGNTSSGWWRVLKGAKGPLGLVTVLAVGVVLMQQTSVQVTIQNKGCATLYPSSSIPSIPGFSMPKDPIASGGSAVMTIPPFVISVDGTQSGALALTALNYSFTFQLPSDIEDVRLNDTSLLGKKSEVHLSEQEKHTLTLSCS